MQSIVQLSPPSSSRIFFCQSLALSPCMFQNILSKRKTCIYWAAAAAKSLQSCPTLCNPIEGSPPGSPGLLSKHSQISFPQALTISNLFSSLKGSAAAAAKLLQSCPTLCDPIEGSPPGSPVPGILQARTLEWVAISSSSAWKWKVKVKSPSRVWLVATPWTAAHQAPLSVGFSRQEYWSGLPLPSPILIITWI